MRTPCWSTLGLCALLLVAPTVLPLGADEPKAAPTPAAAAAAVRERLKDALEAGDEEGVVEALAGAAGSGDEALAKDVRDALQKTKSKAVRHAAVATLGRMPGKTALDALHAYLKQDRQLEDDEALFALTLKEIGRHGSKRSLDVLLDDVFRRLTVASGTARLMAIANIRAPESVEGLIAAGKKGGGTGRRGVSNDVVGALRPAFRVAMVVLTGHDEGIGAGTRWELWWKDEGKRAGVPEQRPAVPAEVRQFWEGFWKEPYGTTPAEQAGASRTPITVVEKPTPEQVAAAVAELEAAFKGKDDEEVIAAALQRHAGLHDKKVLHEVARGLASPNRRVRWITIDALGWSRYGPALKQLHRVVARERDLSDRDEALFAHLLKAIGRHGDKSSLEVLANNPLKDLTYASGQARILGLARIREKKSIEELIGAMKLAGDRPRRRGGTESVPRFLTEMQLAMAVLTGQDKGRSKDAWIDWWRDNEKSFKMSPVPPTISRALRAIWEDYWEEPYEGAR
jgi:HEAT repeat protein